MKKEKILQSLFGGLVSAMLITGCGKTDYVSENSATEAIQDNAEDNIEDDSKTEGDVAPSGAADFATIEEKMNNATKFTRENWEVSSMWADHPGTDLEHPGIDSIQICDMFFYQGMTFEELYSQLTSSITFLGNDTGFGIRVGEGTERVWTVPDRDELSKTDIIVVSWDVYVPGNLEFTTYPDKDIVEKYNYRSMTITVKLYNPNNNGNEDDGWVYDMELNLGDSLTISLQQGVAGFIRDGSLADWALFRSCCRSSEKDELIPYDMYKDYYAEP